MKQESLTTGYGLKELPIDTRDFPLGAVYGTVDITDVPATDFVVAEPLIIKDQRDTDFCSAYAVTGVSEDQESVILLPEYQFYSTKRITGDPEEWGADLRSACKSAIKYGSVPTDQFPQMAGKPRSFILDSRNWPASADPMASIHKKDTFFAVTGKYDIFDNIRCALWQNKADKSTIVTGALWKSVWLSAPNGVIPDLQGDGFGHAFKIFGQKTVAGELCLMAQLSNGTEIGDNGIFYFNRVMANRELGKYGIFMFKDISVEDAQYYLGQPFTVNTPWYAMLWSFIISIFK